LSKNRESVLVFIRETRNDKHQTMVQDKRQKLKDKSEKGTLGTRRTTQGRKTTCRESQTGNRKTLNTEHFKMNKNI